MKQRYQWTWAHPAQTHSSSSRYESSGLLCHRTTISCRDCRRFVGCLMQLTNSRFSREKLHHFCTIDNTLNLYRSVLLTMQTNHRSTPTRHNFWKGQKAYQHSFAGAPHQSSSNASPSPLGILTLSRAATSSPSGNGYQRRKRNTKSS